MSIMKKTMDLVGKKSGAYKPEDLSVQQSLESAAGLKRVSSPEADQDIKKKQDLIKRFSSSRLPSVNLRKTLGA